MTRLTDRLSLPQADPCDFSPPLIRLQESPPSPLGRRVLLVLFALLVALLAWSAIGRLDIVAVAEGKLVPQSFLKIVQPAESGIVREILVREGQAVAEGQVLMRMDALISEADRRTLEADFQRKTLTLGRIDAELGRARSRPMRMRPPALRARLRRSTAPTVPRWKRRWRRSRRRRTKRAARWRWRSR